MPKFAAPLDLQKSELRNAVTQNLGTAPPGPLPGLRYYDTILNVERYWNGTRWVSATDTINASDITGLGALAYLDQVGAAQILPLSITNAQIATAAGIDLSKLAVNPLDRANHTGTQLAATISDFDTRVRTNPVNLLAQPTGPLDMGGQTITNLATPTLPSDATNKSYVDNLSAGIDIHEAVRVATTSNLNGWPLAIDGVTLVVGDRILVKDQDDLAFNGIYVLAAVGLAVRASDADENRELNSGTYVLVTEGDVNRNSGWIVTSDNPILVGTTPIVWQQFSAGGGSSYVGTADRISIIGTQIDIAANYAGQASLTTLGTVTSGVWGGTPVDVAHGGTGGTTAAEARAALGTIGKFTATIGNNVDKSFELTHGLNTLFVGVEMCEAATGQTVYADVRRTTTNKVTIDGFNDAPTVDALNVTIWG